MPEPSRRITEQALLRFMQALDPDPSAAAAAYEDMRRKLVRFFEFRQVISPEDLADEVLYRLAAKIDVPSIPHDLSSFAYGIAKNVALEHRRERARIEPLGDSLQSRATSIRESMGKARDCLDRCLTAIGSDARQVVLEYYAEDKVAKIEARKELAERLGLSINALRIRAMRIRDKIEACVQRCMEKN